MASRRTARPEPGTRYEQRRLEVLRASARTFNRLGFHNATLDDVAHELGFTKPALYYYARSKDELIFACGTMALDALAIALDRSSQPDLTARERLCGFFRLYAEVICEDFGRCLVFTEPGDLAPDSRRETVARRRELNNAIREIIREGIHDGSIAPCDDRSVAMALFAVFNGLARWYDGKGSQPLTAIVDQYLSLITDGIGTQPQTPAGSRPAKSPPAVVATRRVAGTRPSRSRTRPGP